MFTMPFLRPAPWCRAALPWLVGSCMVATAWAGPQTALPLAEDATQVQACLDQAAQRHGVEANLLRAVAMQESGMQPAAWRRNTDGSEDMGLMQVNSRWLPALQSYGITRQHLMQACVSADVGAWILRQMIERHGHTWQGVAAYHSSTPAHNQRYAWAVYRRLQAMRTATALAAR